jgi:hypothetical protein
MDCAGLPLRASPLRRAGSWICSVEGPGKIRLAAERAIRASSCPIFPPTILPLVTARRGLFGARDRQILLQKNSGLAPPLSDESQESGAVACLDTPG